MASFAGLRGTGSWGTDERPKNFREGILFYNPNGVAPIFALTSMMKTQPTTDPEFAHWEEKLDVVRLQVNDGTGYTATSNTFTVYAAGLGTANAQGLYSAGALVAKAGDQFMVEVSEVTSYANEIVEVSSVTNDTTIVFKRGSAGTTATGIANGTYLTKIGSAYQEGGNTADFTTRNPTKVKNYTQIFKTSVGVTATAEQTEARTGDAFANDKKRKAFDHARDIEMAILFGQSYEDTSGTFPKRFMGGLRQMITTNVTIFSTSPTEATLVDALSPMFNFNSSMSGDQRLGFCGNGFLTEFNKLIMQAAGVRINYDKEGSDIYGMSFRRFTTPQGEVMLKSHPLMNRHPRFTYSAFFIDPAAIAYRPLRNRDTKFEDHTETPGKDSHEGQWLTECGIELTGEFTCAFLSNFVL